MSPLITWEITSLGFQRLPHIGIERAFGDVTVKFARWNFYCPAGRIRPSRLFYVPSARCVEVMQGNQSFLHVVPEPIFCVLRTGHGLCPARTERNRPSSLVRIVILNEGNFVFGDASRFNLSAMSRYTEKPRLAA